MVSAGITENVTETEKTMTRTKAARSSGNCSTPKTSTRTDEHIITDYERGTRYAAYILCGMFAFMIAWMWLAW